MPPQSPVTSTSEKPSVLAVYEKFMDLQRIAVQDQAITLMQVELSIERSFRL